MSTFPDNMTHYEVLEILPTASYEVIKAVFRVLSLKYHPDTGSEKNVNKMRRVNLAKEILLDSEKRKEYDRLIGINQVHSEQYRQTDLRYSDKDVETVVQKNWWKQHDLALILEITDEAAENLLKILGYKFHDKIMIYSRTAETDAILADLRNYL